MALHVVTGAPASGKSTWVRRTAKPGDIRFDSDALTNVLSGKTPGRHVHPRKIKQVSTKAREAGIIEALRHVRDLDVWIIHTNLSPELERRYRQLGARFIIIDPGEEENLRRCRAERPGYKVPMVSAWYARRSSWPRGARIITPDTTSPEPDQDPAPRAARPDTCPATVHLVTGPPGAGKSTFVRDRRQPGDITIDYDTLANALAGVDPDNHDHPRHIKTATKAARQAAIDAALQTTATVWIIHSSPAASTLERYRQLGATIHTVDPGKEVVMKRVKAERPPQMLAVAGDWYAKHGKTTKRKTTTERGLGWEHQKVKARLMAVHRDGTPCWWCDQPMYRKAEDNFDGQPLAADHEDARKYGGTKANRLLHGSCNSSRQAGDRDDQRPALGIDDPEAPPAPQGRSQVFSWPD